LPAPPEPNVCPIGVSTTLDDPDGITAPVDDTSRARNPEVWRSLSESARGCRQENCRLLSGLREAGCGGERGVKVRRDFAGASSSASARAAAVSATGRTSNRLELTRFRGHQIPELRQCSMRPWCNSFGIRIASWTWGSSSVCSIRKHSSSSPAESARPPFPPPPPPPPPAPDPSPRVQGQRGGGGRVETLPTIFTSGGIRPDLLLGASTTGRPSLRNDAAHDRDTG